MSKCSELYQLVSDNEARPFWKDCARDAQADIRCAMGCGAQLAETPQLSDPAPRPQRLRSPPPE